MALNGTEARNQRHMTQLRSSLKNSLSAQVKFSLLCSGPALKYASHLWCWFSASINEHTSFQTMLDLLHVLFCIDMIIYLNLRKLQFSQLY